MEIEIPSESSETSVTVAVDSVRDRTLAGSNLGHWDPCGDYVLPAQDPRDVPANLNIGNQHHIA
jgi:hypothetical protein